MTMEKCNMYWPQQSAATYSPVLAGEQLKKVD